MEKRMNETWRKERWHLTIFPVAGSDEQAYIITKTGEIKTYANIIFANQALFEEYDFVTNEYEE